VTIDQIIRRDNVQLETDVYYAAVVKLYTGNVEHRVIYRHGFSNGVGCMIFNPTYEDGYGIQLDELGKNARLAVLRKIWEPRLEPPIRLS
jgi:hypothetical protein